MSHMNFGLNILTYEDSSVTNPTIRSLDISRSFIGIAVSGERTDKIENLIPGESRVIASTLRTITQDATTSYSIVHPWSDDASQVRLQWTGTGTTPGFATKRSVGTSSTTVVTITRLNAATCRVTTSVVAMNTATVQVGDWLKFEKDTDTFTSKFSVINQTAFRIIAKGTGYVDVTDNGVMSEDSAIALGADYDKQMRIFSNGPVKVGDILDISGAGQNPNNAGKFTVTEVSYDYVQFVNPYAVDLSFVVGTDSVQIYDKLMSFVFVRASDVVSIKINGGDAMKINKMGSNEALFMGSIEAYQIELLNEEQTAVSATVHYSSII